MAKDKAYILLDMNIAMDFHEQAMKTSEYPLDCGKMFALKRELMNLCGVTELEAHNVLIGRNVKDYIKKYAGKFEGKNIEIKEYKGDVEVVFKITDDERDIFYGD